MIGQPRRSIESVIMIFLTASTLAAQQAQNSSDPEHACDSAKNQMEINQCAGEQYHKADARLNAVYRKTLETLKTNLVDAQSDGQIKHGQQGIEKLKAAEKAWVQYRDLHCDAARQQYEGGSMAPMVWGFCMAKTTLDRIKELKSAYEEGDRKLE